MAMNSANGSNTSNFGRQMQIVPRTNGYFTVMWMDAKGSVWSTELNHKTETSIDSGTVEIRSKQTYGKVGFF